MKKSGLLILLLFCGLLSGYGYSFRQYKVENGLSQNTVWCILQDQKGFMWFGTKDGLNRFDGIHFKLYTHQPEDSTSIGNNFIRSLYQNTDEKLWVGTDKKLYIYDPEREVFFGFNVRSEQGTQITEAVNSIVSDKKGNIWMAVFGQGVFRYHQDSGKLVHYQHHPDRENSLSSDLVWTIYVDQDDEVWIGTLIGGLNKYRQGSDDFECYLPGTGRNSISSGDIYCIYNDSRNNLWIGTWNGGLNKFNRAKGEFTHYLTNEVRSAEMHIRSIDEFDENVLLVGSDSGLYLFHTLSGNLSELPCDGRENSLSDNAIYSICKDTENGFWIGTYFGGVNYLHPYNQIFEHWSYVACENSLAGKAISQICEDEQGNIWIATEDAGLNKYNTRTGYFTRYSHSPDGNSISADNIHALLYDHGKLWIGTYTKGVDVLDLRTNAIKNYQHQWELDNSLSDNAVYAIYKDQDGTIYIGTIGGLNRYNELTDDFTRIEEIGRDTYVYDIIQDAYGFLWFATYGKGVFKYNPRTGKWIQYMHDSSDPASLCHDKVISLYCDTDNRLWLGTEGGGLCRYDYEEDHFSYRIGKKEGLPNEVIYSILEDDHKALWLSTNNSLVRFFPESRRLKKFTWEDGLQSNQFNYKSEYRGKDGKMYFGGVNGMNVFHPGEIRENQFIPPVIISGMQIGNREVVAGKEGSPLSKSVMYSEKVILKPFETHLCFDFVALSYCSPSKNQYAYKLEPQDKEWNYMEGQNRIYYNNLPPGDYTLYVKGSNNDHVWNEEGALLKLTVLPPLWRSLPAKIIYCIAGLGLIVGMVVFFIRLSNRKHVRAWADYEAKKEKEIYDQKINFFTNIAHEIRTPLSLIKAPLESIIHIGESSEEVKENLRIMQLNTERLHTLINQLLDFRKIGEGKMQPDRKVANVNKLLEKTVVRFKRQADAHHIDLRLILPETVCYEMVDSESIIKVVSNLLTNALKYTTDHIRIELIPASADFSFFEIRVSDNGSGIPEEYRQKIFDPFYQVGTDPDANYVKKEGTGLGLAFVKSIVEMHQGKIFVAGKMGEGTTFIVQLPHEEHLSVPVELLSQGEKEEGRLPLLPGKCGEIPVILVVEDNTDLRNYLERSLSQKYQVLTAEHGKAGLKLLKEYPVNVIVSDLIMPEMDGLELCRIIKSDTEFSHIPMIMLTAKTDLPSKVETLEAGADVYIEKPFSIAYLIAQISSLLENREKLCRSFISSPDLLLPSIASNKPEEVFLQKLNACIEENMANLDFSVDILAREMAMSRSSVHRKIKGISGLAPNDFIRLVRLKKAAELLAKGEYQISEICYIVGFNTPSYFAKCFQKQFGVLPRDFGKGKGGNK